MSYGESNKMVTIEFASGKDFGDGDTIDQDLQDALAKKYGEDRPDIHVSDLTLCPRETCFKKMQPKPMTLRELMYFTSGEAIHGCIEGLVTEFPSKYESDKYTKEGDNRIWYKDLIVCTPDLMNKDAEIIYELKSTRDFKCEEPKLHHLRQLLSYMAIHGKKIGYVKYELLDPYKVKMTKIALQKKGELKTNYDPTVNPFPKWRITMDAADTQMYLDWLEREAISLKNAILAKDPHLARHIAYDAEFIDEKGINWKCRSCKYRQQCEDMRAKDRAVEFNKPMAAVPA